MTLESHIITSLFSLGDILCQKDRFATLGNVIGVSVGQRMERTLERVFIIRIGDR